MRQFLFLFLIIFSFQRAAVSNESCKSLFAYPNLEEASDKLYPIINKISSEIIITAAMVGAGYTVASYVMGSGQMAPLIITSSLAYFSQADSGRSLVLMSLARLLGERGNYLTVKTAKKLVEDKSFLEYWLKQGLELNHLGENLRDIKDRKTLLHRVQDLEIATLLIENGADPYARSKINYKGETKSRTAIEYHTEYGGSPEIGKYLKSLEEKGEFKDFKPRERYPVI